MTKERQDLIDKFQKWLDTNPREQIIAAQCATIAQKYAEEYARTIGLSEYIDVKDLFNVR